MIDNFNEDQIIYCCMNYVASLPDLPFVDFDVSHLTFDSAKHIINIKQNIYILLYVMIRFLIRLR